MFSECSFFAEGSRIQRQISSDSMSSINSMSSACSFSSQQSAITDIEAARKKKKKGWVCIASATLLFFRSLKKREFIAAVSLGFHRIMVSECESKVLSNFLPRDSSDEKKMNLGSL